MKGDFKLELIPEATDGIAEELVVVTRGHGRVAVGEDPEVRREAAPLRRTPEASALAGVVVKALAIAVARWQHGKAESVHAVATVPAALGLELCSGDILTANSREQSFPFRFTGQMPTCGTDSADRFRPALAPIKKPFLPTRSFEHY